MSQEKPHVSSIRGDIGSFSIVPNRLAELRSPRDTPRFEETRGTTGRISRREAKKNNFEEFSTLRTTSPSVSRVPFDSHDIGAVENIAGPLLREYDPQRPHDLLSWGLNKEMIQNSSNSIPNSLNLLSRDFPSKKSPRVSSKHGGSEQEFSPQLTDYKYNLYPVIGEHNEQNTQNPKLADDSVARAISDRADMGEAGAGFAGPPDMLIDSKKSKTSLFVYQTIEADKNIQQRYQEKTLELAQRYNDQSVEAITNFFGDIVSLVTLFYLLYVLEIQINITQSFLLEVFFGLDDTKKSLLILLITDLLVGYHSSNLWELFFELFFNHYGLPESQTGIFLLVATLPVLLDVLFKV
jgi:hypothetical protein